MTGTGIRDAILLIIGNLFAAFLAMKAFGWWVQENYGQAVSGVIGAIFVALFVWFPDQAVSLLRNLVQTTLGI